LDVRALILKRLREAQEVRASDIARGTGYSRVYVHRILKSLVEDGALMLIGKANQARYIAPDKEGERIRELQLTVRRILQNKNLAEHLVLADIKRATGIFIGLRKSVTSIVDYAFTEMLNNAIEHSQSSKIELSMARTKNDVRFEVTDYGVGIFDNIMTKKHLRGRMDAIQDLLKGKETTAPEGHSGEGIFFTSKIADSFIIRSSEKKLVFDNLGDDIYIRDLKPVKGTRVSFTVAVDTAKELTDVFSRYTDDSYTFSKTKVSVNLYQGETEYVSRSQARRILTGLEKFQTVELDFKGIETVGQAFADEVFRVWQTGHTKTKIVPYNAGENVMFMIRRAKGAE
jgi:anti-sigma regulatory factor (Ser/Thr protein kinase)